MEAVDGQEAVAADMQITYNFIATCGLRALEIITNIVAPREIHDMLFSDVCIAIEGYLEPRAKLIVAERANFYECKQNAGEPVAQFVANLRKAAQSCDFS